MSVRALLCMWPALTLRDDKRRRGPVFAHCTPPLPSFGYIFSNTATNANHHHNRVKLTDHDDSKKLKCFITIASGYQLDAS